MPAKVGGEEKEGEGLEGERGEGQVDADVAESCLEASAPQLCYRILALSLWGHKIF